MLQPHDSIEVTSQDDNEVWWYGHDSKYQYFYTFAEKDKKGNQIGNYVLWVGMKEHFDRWANSRDFMLVVPHEFSWSEISGAIEKAVKAGDYDEGWAKEVNLEKYMIEPCIFCSSADVDLEHLWGESEEDSGVEEWSFAAGCNSCGASGSIKKTRREAIYSWEEPRGQFAM